jgi:hypothetical protein
LPGRCEKPYFLFIIHEAHYIFYVEYLFTISLADDYKIYVAIFTQTYVSIPYGFSNALRLTFIYVSVHAKTKFQSLMGFPMRCDPRGSGGQNDVVALFQSLMGFPMRCDLSLNQVKHIDSIVSIPYGFSNALRLVTVTVVPAAAMLFQSLMGFPMRCDNSIDSSCNGFIYCFNPLWVFQCAATWASVPRIM